MRIRFLPEKKCYQRTHDIGDDFFLCPAIQFWAFSGFRTFSGDSTPSLILRFNPCFMGLMVFSPHVWWLPRPNCWWLLSPGLTTISGRLNHHSGGQTSRNCSPNCMLHLLSHGRSFNRRAWSWSTLGFTRPGPL